MELAGNVETGKCSNCEGEDYVRNLKASKNKKAPVGLYCKACLILADAGRIKPKAE